MGLYQRKDSPWWWYLLEGTTIRKSTGVPHTGVTPEQTRALKREAQKIYIDARAKYAKDGAQITKPTISFKDFARWYEEHHLAHQRSTVRGESMVRQLSKTFGSFKSLADIQAHHGREWMTARAKQVSHGTVNRELDMLKALLRAAVPRYLDVSPFAELRRYRLPEREARVLTEDEETRLLAVCTAEDRAFVVLALDTLLRLSSVVQLKWAQVKFAQRSILPLNAKVSTDAKPMSTRLETALKALERDGEYVFSSFHQGGKTSARHHAIRRFDRLCALAGVPHGRAVNGVTFHCLRHTGATRALQRGASLRTVMKLGGWKLPSTVLRYLHVADADVIAAAESIGNHVTRTRPDSAQNP